MQPLIIPISENKYTGSNNEYIVFTINSETPSLFADNLNINSIASISVNLYLAEQNQQIIKQCRHLLRQSGFFIINTNYAVSNETSNFHCIIDVMLKDLDQTKIKINLGGKNLYLRYNLTARRFLEEFYSDYDGFLSRNLETVKADDVINLLRAGLIDCFYEQNELAIEKGDWDSIIPTKAELGKVISEDNLPEIKLSIVNSFIESLPVPEVSTKRNFLKAMIKSIMKK